MDNVVFQHEYIKKDVVNALVVTGFPTVGFVGTIAARFIVNQLKLDLIGAFLSDFFQPVTVISDGVPAPPVRIYGGDRPCGITEECDQIIVITSEFLPPPQVLRPLANHIFQWCDVHNCQSIVAIEGFNASNGENEAIFGVASKKSGRQFLEKYNVKLMQDGMISGLSGILLYEGDIRNIDTMCLLAGTQNQFPDAAAAARSLEVVNGMLPEIEIDPEPLYKESERIEQDLKKHLQESHPTFPGSQSSLMFG